MKDFAEQLQRIEVVIRKTPLKTQNQMIEQLSDFTDRLLLGRFNIEPEQYQRINAGIDRNDAVVALGRLVTDKEWAYIRKRIKNSHSIYQDCVDVIQDYIDRLRKKGLFKQERGIKKRTF